jgi:poly(hydroxyalkanoate) depolymerase family esterase
MSTMDDTARIVTGTYDGPEGRRDWRLAMPSGHHEPAQRPLLVMLHGCLQDAADIARGTQLDAIAASAGILVLYPEQPATANPRKCWNWFDAAHQSRDAGEPALLAALIADVVRTQGADPTRVHLAGISAGGAMATLLAVAYPERFASLTSVAGVGWRAAPDVGRALAVMQAGAGEALPDASALLQAMGARARAMPVLIVHGSADNVVSVRNADDLARQFVGVHNALRAQAGQGALTMTEVPVSEANGYAVQERQWRDSRGEPHVTLVRIDGLGHAWPHGSTTGSFTDPGGPALAERLGAFAAEFRP